MKPIILILSLMVMLTACRTVPQTVIGTETRKEINTLKEEASKATNQAEAIDASVDSITNDIGDLENKAPDVLKPEIHALQEKITILAGLTETHKTATQAVKNTAVKVEDSFGKDMEKTAVLGEEKAKAEIKAAKATGQRNVACLILAGIGIASLVVIWLKFKTGILGIVKKWI